jgi:DNA-binding MarR family transcriptional regulator
MTLNSEILILFRTIEQGYQSRLSVLAKSAGLSTLEGTILSFLHCNPGLESPSAMIHLLNLSKGDVSMAVAHLVSLGYLAKSKDEEDLRKSRLVLLEPAQKISQEIDEMRENYLEEILQGFSHVERSKGSRIASRGFITMSAPTKDLLGTGNIKSLLFKLSINMLYNLVDRIYIGHIPESGAIQLTALGICTPLILAVSAFAYLVGSGGGPRASIASGEKNNAKAEKILANSTVLLVLLGILLTSLLLLFNRPMLLAFGGSEKTIDYALDYMNIYALGTLFVELTLGLNCFISAMGKTTTAMLSVLIGAVLNIALDPLFIFVFNMGVKGAAWATIISQAVSCVWVVDRPCGDARPDLRGLPWLIRDSDRLPTNLHRHRRCQKFSLGRHHAKIHLVDPSYLSRAAHLERQPGVWGLSGGADRGFSGGFLHGHSLLFPKQESPQTAR